MDAAPGPAAGEKQASASPDEERWNSFRWLTETPALPPEVRQIIGKEAEALVQREATMRESQDTQRADQEFIEVIRHDILPQCRRAREALTSNKYPNLFSVEMVEQLQQFLTLRARAWKLMEQAFEQRSQSLAQQHVQLMFESQQALVDALREDDRK